MPIHTPQTFPTPSLGTSLRVLVKIVYLPVEDVLPFQETTLPSACNQFLVDSPSYIFYLWECGATVSLSSNYGLSMRNWPNTAAVAGDFPAAHATTDAAAFSV